MKTFEILYSSKYNGEDFEHLIAGLKTELIEADNEHQACFEFGKVMAHTNMTIEILRVEEKN